MLYGLKSQHQLVEDGLEAKSTFGGPVEVVGLPLGEFAHQTDPALVAKKVAGFLGKCEAKGAELN